MPPLDIVQVQGDIAKLEGDIATKLQQDIDNLAIVVIAIREALQQPVTAGKPILAPGLSYKNAPGATMSVPGGLAGRHC